MELCWRSLMTLLYWEWHSIPRWLLRSIFTQFPEQLLKYLVSWGSPGKYSMIDCSLEEKPIWWSPACFGVLFCSVVFGCRYTIKRQDRVVSGASFLTVGVFKCDLAHSQSVAVLCMLYKIRCNPMLYGALPVSYVLMGVTCSVRSYIGTLMCLIAAEPCSTTRHLCPVSLSGTILVTPYLMVWDWWVLRARPMPFYWPSFSLQFFPTASPFASFILWIGTVGLRSLDW